MTGSDYWTDHTNDYTAPASEAVRIAGPLVYLQRALSLLDDESKAVKAIREQNAFKPGWMRDRPNLAGILLLAQDGKFKPDNLEAWSNDEFAARYVSEGWIEAKNSLLAVTGSKDLEGLKRWCSPWWRSKKSVRRALLQAMAKVNGY